jgi:hypothetical protein
MICCASCLMAVQVGVPVEAFGSECTARHIVLPNHGSHSCEIPLRQRRKFSIPQSGLTCTAILTHTEFAEFSLTTLLRLL